MARTFSTEITKNAYGKGYILSVFQQRGGDKQLIATTPHSNRKTAEKDAELKLARYRKHEQEQRANHYSLKAYTLRKHSIHSTEGETVKARAKIVDTDVYGYRQMKEKRSQIYQQHKHTAYSISVYNETRHKRIK